MGSAIDLTREQLEQIGSYVREYLGTWIRVVDPPIVARMEPEYLERMVRIEEELKGQRELMQQGFVAMERRFDETRADMNARFEQMDRRYDEARADRDARFNETRADMNSGFEQVDKRFEDSRHHTKVWMTVLTIIIAVTSFAGPLVAAMVTG
ncbi:MAG: hypothetical protein ACOC2N_02640 [Spirochaetota bacterium]